MVALSYSIVGATFPDEPMYLATNWLHGTNYWDISGDRIISQGGFRLLKKIDQSGMIGLRQLTLWIFMGMI
jgi:hypothetical protein